VELYDSKGNLHVSNLSSITKITPQGLATSISGFQILSAITIDHQDNLYLSDIGDHCIKTLSSNGKISIIAGNGDKGLKDGPALMASFHYPKGIAVDKEGTIFVADSQNHRIRKITKGIVSTFAGSRKGFIDGIGTVAEFSHPWGLGVDTKGELYVADWANCRIRKITQSGVVSTITMNGKANQPYAVAIDEDNTLYVCEADCVRRRSPVGEWELIVGGGKGQKDGVKGEAGFVDLSSICVWLGCLYVYDRDRVRKIII